MKLALVCAAALAAAVPAPAAPALTGPARVIDGDTLVIGQTHVRLWGIDAPEHGAPGGRDSTVALRALTAGLAVTCRAVAQHHGRDRYGRTVAVCATPETPDLACAQVAHGFARDWAVFSGGFYQRCGR